MKEVKNKVCRVQGARDRVDRGGRKAAGPRKWHWLRKEESI